TSHLVYYDFCPTCCLRFFSFNDSSPTDFYTLSLHDALPIYTAIACQPAGCCVPPSTPHRSTRSTNPAIPARWPSWAFPTRLAPTDRKSTRLNSSHVKISYAVFCLKKKITMKNKLLEHLYRIR